MPTQKQPEKRSELRPPPPSTGQSAPPLSAKGPAPAGSFTMPSVASTSIPAMGSAAFGGLETHEPLTDAQSMAALAVFSRNSASTRSHGGVAR